MSAAPETDEPEALREARERRTGRGKLSSIDMLPPEAEPDVLWALEQLRDNKLPQTIILVGFNDRLVARGIAPISKGAWSRYAVRKAIQFRKMDEVRRISGELASQLGADGADEITIMIAEMIKTAAFELLEDRKLGPKELMELSRSLSSVVGAQKASAEHRRKLQEDIRTRVDAAIEAVGEKLEGEPGQADPSEVLRRIREDVYGIFDR